MEPQKDVLSKNADVAYSIKILLTTKYILAGRHIKFSVMLHVRVCVCVWLLKINIKLFWP